MRAKPARALAAAAAVCAASVTVAQPATALPGTALVAVYPVTKSAVNTTRNLLFTIYNPGGMVQGLSFNYPLPAGLAFAGPLTESCAAIAVDDEPIQTRNAVPAPRGPLPTATVYVAGNTIIGEFSCTVTVPVTSATEAHYATCAAGLQGLSGISTSFTCTHIWFEDRHPHFAAE
ncbi:hypothetical protein V5P93_005264 [Actinokineospora auranticolor]|uniref:Tat pathway signal sequence domain protein n=1 Tax=Actinokineospora auranticolor TaxID=155976 RepID=A0A2S6GD63_9PSEU|nr:hypothetical protein [Actinokineospora auranticolor]PPK63120.1 hypothetical protein CLV40_13253 [Actinokineospora auranticolor]